MGNSVNQMNESGKDSVDEDQRVLRARSDRTPARSVEQLTISPGPPLRYGIGDHSHLKPCDPTLRRDQPTRLHLHHERPGEPALPSRREPRTRLEIVQRLGRSSWRTASSHSGNRPPRCNGRLPLRPHQVCAPPGGRARGRAQPVSTAAARSTGRTAWSARRSVPAPDLPNGVPRGPADVVAASAAVEQGQHDLVQRRFRVRRRALGTPGHESVGAHQDGALGGGAVDGGPVGPVLGLQVCVRG